MGSTPILNLPYPELTDTPDVPRDIKALADAVENKIPVKWSDFRNPNA